MSTKIYTGFCMDCPIDQAVPFLQKCREDMTPQVKELFMPGLRSLCRNA